MKLTAYGFQMFRVVLVLSIMTAFLTGCMTENEPSPTSTAEAPKQNLTEKETEPAVADKQTTKAEPKDSDKASDTLEISSSNNENKDDEVQPNHQPVKDTPEEFVVNHAYSPSSPSLMGFSLWESKGAVELRLGEPDVEYSMEDEDGQLKIWEYQGFLIGFNPNDMIKFVEVSSSSISPGLNGLKIGDTSSAALEILGQPDANTDFVLTYYTEETVLKLDMDPQTNIIHSIKLFPQS
jgi:hypothetical protein